MPNRVLARCQTISCNASLRICVYFCSPLASTRFGMLSYTGRPY